MTQKIAVMLIHGIGKQDSNYGDSIIFELKKQFSELLSGRAKNPASEIIVDPVYWAPVIQRNEDKLWSRVKHGGNLDFRNLRRLMIDFAADSIAYQPIINDRKIYDGVHKIIAKSMKHLASHAGTDAPLCIIAHSLGSIIISNYIWDLQNSHKKPELISETVRKDMGKSPLEQGKTLTSLYTLGSPIALWSLRYDKPDFGTPITIPAKELDEYYPQLKGEWINYYDKDDILAYPLKTLNDEYHRIVTADKEINVGDIFSSWNPASHLFYWKDSSVINPIASSLANIWVGINS